ncbi:MAG: MBL fold metallo-hydrolase [Candidatus Hodarchaeota archaeon]
MEVQKIGTRGLLFSFPNFKVFPQVEVTIQIYVINEEKHLFICDTGLGVEQMSMLKQYLKNNNLDSKPKIIFNSHFHWDHIAGNGVFKSAQIISHILCRKKLIESMVEITEEDREFLKGASIKYPSIVFQQKLRFHEEDVEFFYSPGHSEDHATCYYHKDKVLFIGDNLLYPIPLITWYRIDDYLETLKNYINIDAETIILGHDLILNDLTFIEETINYIRKFQSFSIDTTNFTPSHAAWYRGSLIYIAMDLKENGKEKEAQRYFRKVKEVIKQPETKPLDEKELKQIEELIKKELGNEY